ncbi:hypothetical protein GCM10023208_29920 [Erythrobacter westpacificensis]|uniref:Sugar transporter n=1 Tax=Erythrobacter westpacificensis TaxID=1055231 RepID=A0ABP9KP72_9SPHN
MAIMERPATPWHLWVIGILALLWNAFGAYDYLMTQTRNEAYMSAFTPQQLEYFYSFPAWMEAFWAIGVWSAFLGAVLLVLRSRFAVHAFVLGLIGLAGSSVYQFTNPAPDGVLDGTGLIMTVVIWTSQILLALYALAMMRRGVLR